MPCSLGAATVFDRLITSHATSAAIPTPAAAWRQQRRSVRSAAAAAGQAATGQERSEQWRPTSTASFILSSGVVDYYGEQSLKHSIQGSRVGSEGLQGHADSEALLPPAPQSCWAWMTLPVRPRSRQPTVLLPKFAT